MKFAWKTTLLALPFTLVASPAFAASQPDAARGSAGLGTMKPDASALPGGEQAKSLLNGLMFYGLLLAAAALVACAARVGWGRMRNHPHHVEAGQSGMLWALVGAVVIGGAGAFISWAFNLGTTIQA